MELKLLQQQLLVNRKILSEMYDDLVFLKQSKSYHDSTGNEELEYEYHNKVVKQKKAIAKMVVLQKALKADRADQLEYERCARYPIIFTGPDFWDDF